MNARKSERFRWQRRLATVGLLALMAACSRGPGSGSEAVVGEAREGGISVALPDAVRAVQVTEARAPGRPLVVIDPGHGGRDPGASGVSGSLRESDVTLTLARELRARLAKGGRVRIALTRDGDTTIALDDRNPGFLRVARVDQHAHGH